MLTLEVLLNTVPVEVVTALKEELIRGGLTGTACLGRHDSFPDAVYLMAQHEREAPFSALFGRKDLATPEAARGLAFGFLLKWEQRPR